MIHFSANYHWSKMTSGVFMLIVTGHLSKTDYAKQNIFKSIANNGHISTIS